jgi:flavorubredoxin
MGEKEPIEKGKNMIREEDINGKVLYQGEDHSFIWLGADPHTQTGVVQTNQYLIVDRGKGVLLDPGGIHLFSRVVSVASRYINLDNIETIIFSHQDPDVSSGIALWLGVTSAKVYIPALWIRFLPHFGIIDEKRVLGIEKVENPLTLHSGAELVFVPTHFLHSAGHYSVYDAGSKTLFTSDIGAAVFEDEQYLFVEDFDEHLELMEPFHKRYMSSNKACKKWVDIVSQLDIEMIAPQHGAIFEEEHVSRFLTWFSQLRCGLDNIDDIYS